LILKSGIREGRSKSKAEKGGIVGSRGERILVGRAANKTHKGERESTGRS